ncbi:Peptidoglycan-associated lipoprotein [subsurface metagenome]
MRSVKFSALFLTCATVVVLLTGCADQCKDLKIRNATQDKLINELRSDLQTTKLNLGRWERQLDTIRETGSVEQDALLQHVTALEEDLTKKKALIASMQQQLLFGGTQLPAELSTMLEDFAKGREMVTYDTSRGIVKFKSDLLFERGSDRVAPAAGQAVKAFCEILNSEQGKKFDVIIAGHTDDIPIGKAETRRMHPTNWHLASHRAISVLGLMAKNKIVPERMSVRGFGEYRPVVPNKPGKKGNPQNRRVEIYVVPKGL